MNGLNWDKDFALDQAADDAELLGELIDIFKDSFKSDLVLMEKGLAEKSAEQISSAAHSIKGAAASLGINGINDLAKVIEEESREGGFALAAEKISDLQQLLKEVQAL